MMLKNSDRLGHARRVLAGVETGWRAVGSNSGWTIPLSLPAIDACLGSGGITVPALHEVHGGAGNGAASGFALWLAGRAAAQAAGAVFWISAPGIGDADALYPPALPRSLQNRLVMVGARQRRDVLWAFEEILVSGQAACVIAETPGMDLTAARRLQLASERGRSLAVALCRPKKTGQPMKAGNSVARTRWRIATCRQGWQLQLMGGRGVRPGEWKVIPKTDATAFSLHLVSASGDGPLPQQQNAAA